MYVRVARVVVREYDSNGYDRCRASTYDSRGLMTGGCDVMGRVVDAVRECLTLNERKRSDIEVEHE